MTDQRATTDFLLGQCARYPALEPQDLLKALHQSVFGCGHFVTDEAVGLARLQAELETAADVGPDTERLDGAFCRVHLQMLAKSGLAAETLFRLFVLSAEERTGDAAVLEEKLTVLLLLAEEGRLPFSADAAAKAITAWRAAGFPACHHSETFRTVYRPAYRVIRNDLMRLLPLFAAIDRKRSERPRVLCAVEGGSASGKTTLSVLLQRVYGCTVFHMDDYFLRPEQRTQARLAEPGGNVDRERFYEEVLQPLCSGAPVRCRRYDCAAGQLLPAVEVQPAPLTVVEGAYSMHPMLAEQYDLSVFLRISAEAQRKRILQRNGPEIGQRFFDQWIPLEQRYFDALSPAERCDLILEAEE